MKAKRLSAGILGASDGLCSISGVIVGGLAANVGGVSLGHAALGGALAAVVSMGGAQWLSEGETDWGLVLAMGLGSLLGGALPILPLLLLNGLAVWPVMVCLAIIVAMMVAEVRHRSSKLGRLKCCMQTFLVLSLGLVVGFLAGFS